MKRKSRYTAILTAVLMAMSAFSATAADPTASGTGIQTAKQYIDSVGSITKSDDADTNADGKLHLSYDTSGGKWEDPGADPTVKDDNGKHDNGTYTVTIPTLIKYENMHVGTVNTSDDYTVNVKGTIPADNIVFISAETGNSVANGAESITETTTQGKKQWTAEDCYGSMNTDGSLSGTDSTDTIALSGEAKSAGTFEGTVAYTANKIQPVNGSYLKYLKNNNVPIDDVVTHTVSGDGRGRSVTTNYDSIGSMSYMYMGNGNSYNKIVFNDYKNSFAVTNSVNIKVSVASYANPSGRHNAGAEMYFIYTDGTESRHVSDWHYVDCDTIWGWVGVCNLSLNVDDGKSIKQIVVNNAYRFRQQCVASSAYLTDITLE